MKFKMRVLHYSPAGNTEKIAMEIARAQQANADRIPPAYPCENEKLIFLGVELKGASADKTVVALCKDLNPSRAKNVAIFAVSSGNFDGVNELKQIITANGLEVAGVHEITAKGGLFKKASLSDAEIKGAVDWAQGIVDSL